MCSIGKGIRCRIKCLIFEWHQVFAWCWMYFFFKGRGSIIHYVYLNVVNFVCAVGYAHLLQ